MAVALQSPAILQVVDVAWTAVNGGESFSDQINNYFTAWLDVPGVEGLPDQRIIVAKLVMPIVVARECNGQAGKAFAKGGH